MTRFEVVRTAVSVRVRAGLRVEGSGRGMPGRPLVTVAPVPFTFPASMFSTEHHVSMPPPPPLFPAALYGTGRGDSAFHVPVCGAGIGSYPGEHSTAASVHSATLSAALNAAGLPRPSPTFPLLDPTYGCLPSPFQSLPSKYAFTSPYNYPGFASMSLPDLKSSSSRELPVPVPGVGVVRTSPTSPAAPVGSVASRSPSPPGSANPHPFAAFLTARECPWFAFPYHQDIFR